MGHSDQHEEAAGDWVASRLKDLVGIDRVRPKRGTDAGADVPFVPMALLPESGLYADRWEMRMPSEVRSGLPIREGDLLLAKITPCFENGKQGIVRGLPHGWGYATTEVHTLRPSKVLSEFLAFFLRVPEVRRSLANKMEGATGRQRLPRAVIEDLEVPCPPMAEQRAVANVLMALQEARAATESVIAATLEVKKSLMRHLFTYGPVPVQDAERVPLKMTEIGLVPEQWNVFSIGDIADISTGTTPSTANRDYYSGSVPFIKTSEIANNVIKAAATHVSDVAVKDCRLRVYPPGTVFLAMYGQGKTRGQVALLDIAAATTQNTAAIVPSERLSAKYLWLYLSSQYEALRGEGIQGHISHLNLGYVRQLRIPVPPKDEQAVIESVLSCVQAKLQVEENRNQALQSVFNSLLRNVMTGRVRVKPAETEVA